MTDRPTDHSWPPVDVGVLGDAVEGLVDRVAEPAVRAQLHALAAVIRSIGSHAAGGDERIGMSQRLAAALAAGDDTAIVSSLRDLARLDRSFVQPVDWSAASGG